MAESIRSGASEPLQIEADVLVVGGGMAACWAAISAAKAGARVVLVDKGYVGTSGVTATGGPGHWWVSPEGTARTEAIEKHWIAGCGLADRGWMERIIDTTWRTRMNSFAPSRLKILFTAKARRTRRRGRWTRYAASYA